MKCKSTHNGLLYWIDGGLVICGTSRVHEISIFTPKDIEEMIEDGIMIPTTEFREMVLAEKARNPHRKLCHLAFIVDNGGKDGSATEFIAWLKVIKSIYIERNAHKVGKSYCTGSYTFYDHEHFTDFVISGEWRDSTNC